jgi:hypothetical protein
MCLKGDIDEIMDSLVDGGHIHANFLIKTDVAQFFREK